ncbi:MAG: TrpB-like pyridoxal phosphate-dependent enzyme [Candidatus Nanopelagicales bacterium]
MTDAPRQHKFVLSEDQMPTTWYNLAADLPVAPPPPLHPGTHEPVGPQAWEALFPEALIEQEYTTERYVEIPGEVLDVYRQWRPSPLYRAYRLEESLGTTARMYYKYEGVSPAGSHKTNTSVPQAYYNAAAGVKKLATETGAGQWATALSYASALYGLECEVWQVGASYDQKPYRRMMIETFGATVHRSPSELTAAGRSYLAQDPRHPGSLGIAISEAVEVAVGDPHTKYALGSVLNHVVLHQTIIGEEVLAQLALAGDTPDVIIGCAGGGSNFAGLSFPFIRENLAGKLNARILAVEPTSCPSLTQGVYAYDFGDASGMTPLMKMHTLGHNFIPDPIHAGGLRYHGMSPLLSHAYDQGLIQAQALKQSQCFSAAVRFARTEGVIAAPESSHAIAAGIEQAMEATETGQERVIVIGLSGHGHLDLSAYDAYLRGTLTDLETAPERFAGALAELPVV